MGIKTSSYFLVFEHTFRVTVLANEGFKKCVFLSKKHAAIFFVRACFFKLTILSYSFFDKSQQITF